MILQVLPPPRKPGRWTWAVAGRLCSRTFVAVTLLWVVALVGWPERHRCIGSADGLTGELFFEEWRGMLHESRRCGTLAELAERAGVSSGRIYNAGEPEAMPTPGGLGGRSWWQTLYHRDADLRVLWDALSP